MNTPIKTLALLAMVGIALSANAASAKTDSIYTDLKGNTCKDEKSSSEQDSAKGRCKGTAGYMLEWEDGDSRQTLNVINPAGKSFPLDFSSTVSGGFSSLGDKAEWRVQKNGKKTLPVALIVRFNASEDPEKPEKTTSYLTVSKITPNEVCVTDVVKPSSDANVQARKLADDAANKPCKKAGGSDTQAEPATATHPIAGGMSAADTQDAEIVKAAEFAAAQLGKDGLDSVLEAAQQVVAGMNYAMTIKLNNGDIYKVRVYHDLQGTYSLTESSKQ